MYHTISPFDLTHKFLFIDDNSLCTISPLEVNHKDFKLLKIIDEDFGSVLNNYFLDDALQNSIKKFLKIMITQSIFTTEQVLDYFEKTYLRNMVDGKVVTLKGDGFFLENFKGFVKKDSPISEIREDLSLDEKYHLLIFLKLFNASFSKKKSYTEIEDIFNLEDSSYNIIFLNRFEAITNYYSAIGILSYLERCVINAKFIVQASIYCSNKSPSSLIKAIKDGKFHIDSVQQKYPFLFKNFKDYILEHYENSEKDFEVPLNDKFYLVKKYLYNQEYHQAQEELLRII